MFMSICCLRHLQSGSPHPSLGLRRNVSQNISSIPSRGRFKFLEYTGLPTSFKQKSVFWSGSVARQVDQTIWSAGLPSSGMRSPHILRLHLRFINRRRCSDIIIHQARDFYLLNGNNSFFAATEPPSYLRTCGGDTASVQYNRNAF
jgi:hypothetical protein